MRFLGIQYISLLTFNLVSAISWNFDEAIISVTGKSGASNAFKDKLSDHVPLASPVALDTTDTLKIIITAIENGIPKRPNQAFLLLRDQDNGLEVALPFAVRTNGKGKLEFSQKDLPIQLQKSSQPLRGTILLASFGPTIAFSNHVFNLDIRMNPSDSKLKYVRPVRYGKLDEIHHILKPDPKNPPIIISIFFIFAVAMTVPTLYLSWAYLGANLSHLPKAMKTAPIAYVLFFGSILAMEFVLFLYYIKWNLFQLLPAASIIGLITFLSGPRALSEVQSRRLNGER